MTFIYKLKILAVCCTGPWCWRWGETLEGPDNGESHKIGRCLPDSSEYHDLSSHAKGCLHWRCYRKSVTIYQIPSTEHTLSAVWPCLQGWPTWRWGENFCYCWKLLLWEMSLKGGNPRTKKRLKNIPSLWTYKNQRRLNKNKEMWIL